MTILKIALAVLMVAVSIGCTKNDSNGPTNANSLHTKVKINYDIQSVEEAMEVKGINFKPQPPQREWVLAGVEPRAYSVGSAREQDEPEEEALIYIFDSDHHREEGLVDFRNKTEHYNMLYPQIYTKRNVLILYWALGDMNQPTELKEKFSNAMTSLHVITEFQGETIGSKAIPFTTWIGVKRYGGVAFDKGAAIESVDTHRNGKVHAIQIRGWRLPSSITVEHKGSTVLIEYKEGPLSHKENVILRFRDDNLDPSRIQISLNGRKQRIVEIVQGIE
ncbi:hypothetical protein [Paenibacillus xanthanilyticus]|uniref:Uncharacterized protein n=1 Tax=Paenibacillus xanthanilyticus TaxID=1783531 RepID=A0ABV8K8V7_9BACL